MDIYEMYKSGMSITEIADCESVSISKSTIRARLKEKGILRSRNDGIKIAAKKGKFSHMKGKKREFTEEWKKNISKGKLKAAEKTAKGFSLKPSGYVEHTRGKNKGRMVHVVIMEEIIGRKLKVNECVHHIDGNRSNNEINNLAFMTKSAHGRLHRREDQLLGKERRRLKNGRFC